MYAIWFVFEKEDIKYFSDTIQELSNRYNSSGIFIEDF